MKILTPLLLVTLSTFPMCPWAESAAAETRASAADRTFEQTLSNGMKIVVREDHRAPVMVSQVWYRIGSSYEHAGVTGVSHVLEHLMFKGTVSYTHLTLPTNPEV